MKDIIQSGLTKNEIDELQNFLNNSPSAKLIDYITESVNNKKD